MALGVFFGLRALGLFKGVGVVFPRFGSSEKPAGAKLAHVSTKLGHIGGTLQG